MEDDHPAKRPDLNSPEFRRMTQERLVRLGTLKNPTAKERAVAEGFRALESLVAAWAELQQETAKKEADNA